MQQEFLVTDASFDEQRIIFCNLLLEIGNSHLAYVVLDHKSNSIVACSYFKTENQQAASISEQIQHLRNNDAWLKLSYGKVYVSIVVEKSTLIPAALYDEYKKEKLYDFNFTNNGEEINSFPIKSQEAVLVYSNPVLMKEFINGHFGVTEFVPHAAIIIQNAMQRFRFKTHPVMMIHVDGQFFDIIIINQNKLQLFNTFSFSNSEDFIYYVLYACEQLQLNPDQIEIQLCGNTHDKTPEFIMLSKYFGSVNFLSRTLNHRFSYEFDEIQTHRLATLFDIQQCVL